jgi:TonB family protein
LEVIIGIDGIPTDIKVKQSGRDSFDAAAISAVSKWRFSPATCSGIPVPSMLEINMDFQQTN